MDASGDKREKPDQKPVQGFWDASPGAMMEKNMVILSKVDALKIVQTTLRGRKIGNPEIETALYDGFCEAFSNGIELGLAVERWITPELLAQTQQAFRDSHGLPSTPIDARERLNGVKRVAGFLKKTKEKGI